MSEHDDDRHHAPPLPMGEGPAAEGLPPGGPAASLSSSTADLLQRLCAEAAQPVHLRAGQNTAARTASNPSAAIHFNGLGTDASRAPPAVSRPPEGTSPRFSSPLGEAEPSQPRVADPLGTVSSAPDLASRGLWPKHPGPGSSCIYPHLQRVGLAPALLRAAPPSPSERGPARANGPTTAPPITIVGELAGSVRSSPPPPASSVPPAAPPPPAQPPLPGTGLASGPQPPRSCAPGGDAAPAHGTAAVDRRSALTAHLAAARRAPPTTAVAPSAFTQRTRALEASMDLLRARAAALSQTAAALVHQRTTLLGSIQSARHTITTTLAASSRTTTAISHVTAIVQARTEPPPPP